MNAGFKVAIENAGSSIAVEAKALVDRRDDAMRCLVRRLIVQSAIAWYGLVVVDEVVGSMLRYRSEFVPAICLPKYSLWMHEPCSPEMCQHVARHRRFSPFRYRICELRERFFLPLRPIPKLRKPQLRRQRGFAVVLHGRCFALLLVRAEA